MGGSGGEWVAVYDGCWAMGLRRFVCLRACLLFVFVGADIRVCYSGSEAPQLGCVSVLWPRRGSGQRGI